MTREHTRRAGYTCRHSWPLADLTQMTMCPTFCRDAGLQRIRDADQIWDVIIIGGGATGVGVAMDAASRGLQTLLVERFDFGKGTSSRSTKLIHGGVRYLQQGNITLVRDALRERARLRKNAPHVVQELPFVIPCESFLQKLYYWFGLKLYDWLARGKAFTHSRMVSHDDVCSRLPTIGDHGSSGGVIYHDGQFDDTRLLIDMAVTAAGQGGCLLNYVVAECLRKNDDGRVTGVELVDQETGERLAVQGRAVVNATGPFCDELRQRDDPECRPLLATSQGVHVTLPRRFLPGTTALIVPKTSDGRVLFLIPWHGHVVVGTTDTAIPSAVVEPRPKDDELRFLLETAGEYLKQRPTSGDVTAVFTGIRPLVKNDPSARTASLSRDHKIVVSESGLVTITGGKWTTVRKMAEDVVDRVCERIGETSRACRTDDLPIADTMPNDGSSVASGEDSRSLHPDLPYRRGDVEHAVNALMARTVDDVLSRRTRALFLNAEAALAIAPRVAEIMATHLSRDQSWQDNQIAAFNDVASAYQMPKA